MNHISPSTSVQSTSKQFAEPEDRIVHLLRELDTAERNFANAAPHELEQPERFRLMENAYLAARHAALSCDPTTQSGLMALARRWSKDVKTPGGRTNDVRLDKFIKALPTFLRKCGNTSKGRLAASNRTKPSLEADPVTTAALKLMKISSDQSEADELAIVLGKLDPNGLPHTAGGACLSVSLKAVEQMLSDEMDALEHLISTTRAQSIAGALAQVIMIARRFEVIPIDEGNGDAYRIKQDVRHIARMLQSVASALLPFAGYSWDELGGNQFWHPDHLHEGSSKWSQTVLSQARKALKEWKQGESE